MVYPRWSKPQALNIACLETSPSMFSSLKQQMVLGEHRSGLEAGDTPSVHCSSAAALRGGSWCKSSSNLGLQLPALAAGSPLLPNFIPRSAWSKSADSSQASCRLAQMVSAETG